METRETVKRLRLAAAALSALLLATSASASTITVFAGGPGEMLEDWELAVSVFAPSISSENYNDSTCFSPSTSCSFDDFDITFVGSGHDKSPVFHGTLGSLTDRITDANMTVFEFDVPIFGFGAIWNLVETFGGGFGLSVTFGGMLVDEIPIGHQGDFWGFVSDIPFDTVILTGGNQGGPMDNSETYFHDDLVYAPVPEPSAALAFGVSLTVAGLGVRRRSR